MVGCMRLGKYIVDFVCLSSRLIIEVDGDGHGHDAREALDALRTADLEKLGFRVMRFWNNDVLSDVDSVAEMIYRELTSLPSPRPSPLRGEGDPSLPSRLRGEGDPKGNLKIGAGHAPR
jgi:hypothetical protein